MQITDYLSHPLLFIFASTLTVMTVKKNRDLNRLMKSVARK
jgi:hypothetical protein